MKSAPTPGESLKAAGYATFVSGKWHVAAHTTRSRIPFQKIVALIGRLLCERILIVIEGFGRSDIYRDGKIFIKGEE